jgi:uncharacterized protein
MIAIFADTFYWVALTDPNDSLYKKAAALDQRLAGALLVTTDEVLIEFLTFFSGDPWLRERAEKTVRSLLSDPSVHVIPQSRASFLAGFELYAARRDKEYSMVDCISMAAMRQAGITEALTNDRHFSQEGFQILFADL